MNNVEISIHAAQEGCDNNCLHQNRHLLKYFNPRSPRGLRLNIIIYRTAREQFQSTQPKRAATVDYNEITRYVDISIHAAQEGCDQAIWLAAQELIYFNPRSPRGLRLVPPEHFEIFTAISIHAAQEGCDRWGDVQSKKVTSISIHAAQEGCDKAALLQHCNNV